MTAWKREQLHLGSSFPDRDDSGEYEVTREDSMVQIETVLKDGTELTVFLHPNLFRQIRDVMESIDDLG